MWFAGSVLPDSEELSVICEGCGFQADRACVTVKKKKKKPPKNTELCFQPSLPFEQAEPDSSPPESVFQQTIQVNALNRQSRCKSRKYEKRPVGAPTLEPTKLFLDQLYLQCVL